MSRSVGSDAVRPTLGRLILGACLALVTACSPAGAGAPSRAVGAGRATASAALTGQDGALTVTTAGTVLNEYAVLAADAAAGATSLGLGRARDLDDPRFGPLAAGDLLLVIQMQGATIDTTNTAAFGNVLALNGAGNYELVHVTGVTGNRVSIETTCGGLAHAYTVAGHTQVVRVPQLGSLTVSGAGSITAPAWDGQRGGVVALDVKDTATLNASGAIDVTGLGFRGGVLDNQTQSAASNVALFRSTNPADGAEKGEGIAGFEADYDAAGGRYGRGAAANGGGGGNAHNGGGGGGANGDDGNGWTGQGVMDATVTGAAAWQLDPAYAANGNALTTSSGGGRGGYTYSQNDRDALTVAPGDPAWAGNDRRPHGGYGGRPLANGPANGRVFLGGGGGAGDANNDHGGGGGAGGGLVFVHAGTVDGTGSILANGAPGVDTSPLTPSDAPGGGGAGGSVVLDADLGVSGVAIQADGGLGGTSSPLAPPRPRARAAEAAVASSPSPAARRPPPPRGTPGAPPSPRPSPSSPPTGPPAAARGRSWGSPPSASAAPSTSA